MKLIWKAIPPPWHHFWQPTIHAGVSSEGLMLAEISPGKRSGLLKVITGMSGTAVMCCDVDTAKIFINSLYEKVRLADEPEQKQVEAKKVLEFPTRIQ